MQHIWASGGLFLFDPRDGNGHARVAAGGDATSTPFCHNCHLAGRLSCLMRYSVCRAWLWDKC